MPTKNKISNDSGEQDIRGGVVCGRKFCARCRKWRLIIDFFVREWWDPVVADKPRTLVSLCQNCCNNYQRERKGYRRRQPSQQSSIDKNEKRRNSYAARTNDDARRERRIKDRSRRIKSGSELRTYKRYEDEDIDWNPMMDAKDFLEWYDSLLDPKPLSNDLYSSLKRARAGGKMRALDIDAICSKEGRVDASNYFLSKVA
jgi:hypothetical protein